MTTDNCDKQYQQLLKSVSNSLGQLSKHDAIRAKHWIDKLRTPTTNLIWKQNRNLYLKIMDEMISDNQLYAPFNQIPPEGALPKITLYDIPYPIRLKMNKMWPDSDRKKDHRKTPSSSKINSSNISRKNSMSRKSSLNGTQKIGRQNNMEHRKKIVFDKSSLFTSVCQDQNQNNQNLPYFNDTLKTQNMPNNTMKTDYQHFLTSIDLMKGEDWHCYSKQNTQKIRFGNNKSIQKQLLTRKGSKQRQPKDEQKYLKQKGLNIMKKAIRLLGRNYEQFDDSILYKETIENIVNVGEAHGENMREITLFDMEDTTMQASWLSQPYQKYAERIKQNFSQSDNNYKQFMDYLQELNH